MLWCKPSSKRIGPAKSETEKFLCCRSTEPLKSEAMTPLSSLKITRWQTRKEKQMRPGANPIEEYKQAKNGNPLLIQNDLQRLAQQGWQQLAAAEKELLKWIGVFFRKPTPG